MFINGKIAYLLTKIEDYSVVVYSNDFGVDKRPREEGNSKIGGVKYYEKIY